MLGTPRAVITLEIFDFGQNMGGKLSLKRWSPIRRGLSTIRRRRNRVEPLPQEQQTRIDEIATPELNSETKFFLDGQDVSASIAMQDGETDIVSEEGVHSVNERACFVLPGDIPGIPQADDQQVETRHTTNRRVGRRSSSNRMQRPFMFGRIDLEPIVELFEEGEPVLLVLNLDDLEDTAD